MKFDHKGHIRSNKALYVYKFSSNNSSINANPSPNAYTKLCKALLSPIYTKTKKGEGSLSAGLSLWKYCLFKI